MMKFSRAISWVSCLSGEKINFSKTISVLVFKERGQGWSSKRWFSQR